MTLKDKILKILDDLPDEDISEVIHEMIDGKYHKEYGNYILQGCKDKSTYEEKAEFYKSLGFNVELLEGNYYYKYIAKILW